MVPVGWTTYSLSTSAASPREAEEESEESEVVLEMKERDMVDGSKEGLNGWKQEGTVTLARLGNEVRALDCEQNT